MKQLVPPGFSQFPLFLVIFSLLWLLLVSIFLEYSTWDMQARLRQTVGAAERQLNQLAVSLLHQVPVRGAFSDPAEYRLVEIQRINERSALVALDSLLRVTDPEARRALLDLRSDLARWHSELNSSAGRAEPLAQPGSLQTAHERLLSSVLRLRGRLAALRAEREVQISAAERLRTILHVALLFATLMATAVITQLNRRRIAARRELEEGRREKAKLLDSIGEGTLGVDLTGRCTFLNPAGARVLGCSSEELVGANLYDRIQLQSPGGPSISLLNGAAIQRLHQGEEIRVPEANLVREDGSSLPVAYSMSPIQHDGDTLGAVVTIADISERVRAEQQRRDLLERERAARRLAEEAEQRASLIADASKLFYSSLDLDTTLRSLTHLVVPRFADSCIMYLVDDTGAVSRLEPTHRDPFLQKRLTALLDRHPPRTETLAPPVREAIETGTTRVIPFVTPGSLHSDPQDKNHRSRFAELGLEALMVSPLKVGDRVLGAISYGFSEGAAVERRENVWVADELAARAALAIDNARLYEDAQTALTGREEILRVVSHDLRNPLNALRLGSQVLLRHWPPRGEGEAERHQLEVMVQATERMGSLIRDLLDLARIDEGHLRVVPEPLEPWSVVERTTELFAALAEERSIHLSHRVSRDLPLIAADNERLIQVLSNLIGNSLRYTPEGGRISIDAQLEESGRVLFSVADTGQGVPEADLPHIFVPYWSGPEGKRQGAGLGLAIVKGIVEEHGGKIWAESRKGEGTTIRFEIPVATRES